MLLRSYRRLRGGKQSIDEARSVVCAGMCPVEAEIAPEVTTYVRRVTGERRLFLRWRTCQVLNFYEVGETAVVRFSDGGNSGFTEEVVGSELELIVR
jgi:hypothetical protein